MIDLAERRAIRRWFWARRSAAEKLAVGLWLLRRAAKPSRVLRVLKRRIGRRTRAGQAEIAPVGLDGRGDQALETERTVLRPFVLCDLDQLASQMRPAEPGGGPSRPRRDGPRWRDEYTLCQEIAGTLLTWAIWSLDGDEPLGIVGLSPLEVDGRPEHELGYRIFPQARGRGFATEAGRAVRAFAEAELGLRRLVSIVEPSNAASIGVVMKLGLRHEKNTTFGGVPVGLYASPPSPLAAVAAGSADLTVRSRPGSDPP